VALPKTRWASVHVGQRLEPSLTSEGPLRFDLSLHGTFDRRKRRGRGFEQKVAKVAKIWVENRRTQICCGEVKSAFLRILLRFDVKWPGRPWSLACTGNAHFTSRDPTSDAVDTRDPAWHFQKHAGHPSTLGKGWSLRLRRKDHCVLTCPSTVRSLLYVESSWSHLLPLLPSVQISSLSYCGQASRDRSNPARDAVRSVTAWHVQKHDGHPSTLGKG
jgi:hypothetical protein